MKKPKPIEVEVKCQDPNCDKVGKMVISPKNITLTENWQVTRQGSDPLVFFCPEHRRALLVPGLIRR